MKANRYYTDTGQRFAVVRVEHRVTRAVAVAVLAGVYADRVLADRPVALTGAQAMEQVRERLQRKGGEDVYYWADGLHEEESETVSRWAQETVDRLWPELAIAQDVK